MLGDQVAVGLRESSLCVRLRVRARTHSQSSVNSRFTVTTVTSALSGPSGHVRQTRL